MSAVSPAAAPQPLEAHLDAVQLLARRFWLTLLRGELTGANPDPTPAQWNSLVREALRHQLGALTYRLLTDGPFATRVPAEAERHLRAKYVEGAFQNAVLLRQTSRLIAQLDKAGIPVMLLKGVHLCRFVYSEPGLRSMSDVDLMVPRERLADAEQVCLQLGYGPVPRPSVEETCARSNHLAKLFKRGAPVLELHWTIELPTSPFRIDLAGLWARSRAAELEGVPVRLLAPEDLVLHLSLHGSYHHVFDWWALKGLVDLDAVLVRYGAELDWAALAERANAWGASGFVYSTLRLAETLLGTPVDPRVLTALRHEPGDEEVVELARRHVLSPELDLPEPYLQLARAPGLKERWRLVRHRVFLPRQTLEQTYGHGHPSVYRSYFRRVLDLLSRRGRLLLQALMRTRNVQSALEREANRRQLAGWVQRRSGDPSAGPRQG